MCACRPPPSLCLWVCVRADLLQVCVCGCVCVQTSSKSVSVGGCVCVQASSKSVSVGVCGCRPCFSNVEEGHYCTRGATSEHNLGKSAILTLLL